MLLLPPQAQRPAAFCLFRGRPELVPNPALVPAPIQARCSARIRAGRFFRAESLQNSPTRSPSFSLAKSPGLSPGFSLPNSRAESPLVASSDPLPDPVHFAPHFALTVAFSDFLTESPLFAPGWACRGASPGAGDPGEDDEIRQGRERPKPRIGYDMHICRGGNRFSVVPGTQSGIRRTECRSCPHASVATWQSPARGERVRLPRALRPSQ